MTDNRRQREIKLWEREKSRPRTKGYLLYLIFIITLIYTIDEVASQIGMLMKTEIAIDLMASFGDSSVGALNILGAIGLPFQILGLAYRPMADKFGRKLFLITNTFGMSFALLLIYLSRSIPLYFIGACLVQFFIPHDMHVVYIMETAPSKHRAKIYSSIKFVATLGVVLIPLLRQMLMENVSEWRRVYFIPALLGLAVCVIALFFCRETDTFIDSRLEYLRSPETKVKESKSAQAGLISAFKYAIKDRQLRWLYIVSALANIGFIASLDYQVIMSYGFAEGQFGSLSIEEIGAGPVTEALMLFPVGCAFSQLITGFVSDYKGRKASAVMSALNCLAGFLGFFCGSILGLAIPAVGLLCGICIGSYYSLNDVINMMVGESAPTSLRSSVMSAQFIVTMAGGLISFAVGYPLQFLLGNQAIGTISFCLLVPGFVLSLIALFLKTRDTNGADLSQA